jgi:hypothetical protein
MLFYLEVSDVSQAQDQQRSSPRHDVADQCINLNRDRFTARFALPGALLRERGCLIQSSLSSADGTFVTWCYQCSLWQGPAEAPWRRQCGSTLKQPSEIQPCARQRQVDLPVDEFSNSESDCWTATLARATKSDLRHCKAIKLFVWAGISIKTYGKRKIEELDCARESPSTEVCQSPFCAANNAQRGKSACCPLHMLVFPHKPPSEMVVLDLKCAHSVSVVVAISFLALDSIHVFQSRMDLYPAASTDDWKTLWLAK